MRSKLVKRKLEHLYDNKDEFYDNEDDELVDDWRESSTGDWILTDDGQVCKILYRGTFSNGNEYVRTILGSYPVRDAIQITGKIADDIYRFTKYTTHRNKRIDEKKPNSREIVFAKYVANGMPPEQAYLRLYKTNDSQYSKTASTATPLNLFCSFKGIPSLLYVSISFGSTSSKLFGFSFILFGAE